MSSSLLVTGVYGTHFRDISNIDQAPAIVRVTKSPAAPHRPPENLMFAHAEACTQFFDGEEVSLVATF
jgi:hypothetical protein